MKTKLKPLWLFCCKEIAHLAYFGDLKQKPTKYRTFIVLERKLYGHRRSGINPLQSSTPFINRKLVALPTHENELLMHAEHACSQKNMQSSQQMGEIGNHTAPRQLQNLQNKEIPSAEEQNKENKQIKSKKRKSEILLRALVRNLTLYCKCVLENIHCFRKFTVHGSFTMKACLEMLLCGCFHCVLNPSFDVMDWNSSTCTSLAPSRMGCLFPLCRKSSLSEDCVIVWNVTCNDKYCVKQLCF